ncbi:hypothetical protein LCGC14_3029620 [marine sediment metagenome]|uniref:Uncharacterized protein n=1 Tax=marine sediment metagenome TaxID=412755 RepID=A0A0F8ZIZ4_9ZZZZ
MAPNWEDVYLGVCIGLGIAIVEAALILVVVLG